MAIRGILFDKDGTLVDFFETWIPAYDAALKLVSDESGDPALADRLMRLGGYDPESRELDPASLLASGTTMEICELWAAEARTGDPRALALRLHDAMEDHASRYPVPVGDGIGAMFERLGRRGLMLGLATMDSEAVARATAEALDIQRFLVFLTGYDSGHGVKPEPGMVYGFCAAAGLSPAEIMVVGDTDRDLRMARAAGAAVAVGVLTGATPRARLEPEADHTIENVLAVEELLDQL